MTMRLMGPLFVLAFYCLIALHAYAFFNISIFVLAQRLGPIYGLIWIAIGFCLLYNVLFNHALSYIVKPGNP